MARKKLGPDELRVRNRQTVALMAAGLPAEAIEQKMQISKRVLGNIRKEILCDPDLRSVFEEAQRKLMPKVLMVAELALERMEIGLQAADCPVHHAAAAYRELVKHSGESMDRVNEKTEPDPLPVKDAAVLVELLTKMFAEERRRAAEKVLEVPVER